MLYDLTKGGGKKLKRSGLVFVPMVSHRLGGVNEKCNQIVTEGKKLAVVSTSR
jgi:hypothetical protein